MSPLRSLGVALTALAAVAVGSSVTPARAGGDIVDVAASNGSFKTLVAAVTEAELVEALQAEGPFTVFAPTDEAFAALPDGTVEALLKPENRAQLVAILTYHVVPGKLTAEDVMDLKSADTLNGQRLAIATGDGSVRINAATVISADVRASNGVIHVIDTVLLPSDKDIVATAQAAGDFGTLLAAAKAAGLVEALQADGPLTVLAPSDAAFAKLPEGTVASLLEPENKDQLVAILTYHVIPGRVYADQALKAGGGKTLQGSAVRFAMDGRKALVNDAALVAVDIDTSNGVIHVIDTVLMPPAESAKADTSTPSGLEVATVSSSCTASSPSVH